MRPRTPIEQIVFDDGTIWSAEPYLRDAIMTGGDGDDMISWL